MRWIFVVLALLFVFITAIACAPDTRQEQKKHIPTDTPTSVMRVTPTPIPSEGLEAGDRAPDISLFGLDGKTHKLSDFQGKVVFLNFWATWCGPCRYEMPSMEQMSQDYKDEGLVILAVDVRESKGKVQRFIREYNLTFPVYLDQAGDAYKKFNKTSGIPQTYIIDRKGIIRAFIPGARDWSTIAQRTLIERILEEEE